VTAQLTVKRGALTGVIRGGTAAMEQIAEGLTFFTNGHSTRPVEEFQQLLSEAGVDFLVDVRSIPRSRTNPQFNDEVLPLALAESAIGYRHIAALGGLRGRQEGIDDSLNAFWENRSFRNYADYMLTRNFRKGFGELLQLGAKHSCATMCAEAVWWHCHRRLITDYLLASGAVVFNIMSEGRTDVATMTPGAVPTSAGLLYPARQ
jgi:uncharacterized protein (DUF488 family)